MFELPRSTDVLIVGAGPVGLALAAALQARGVDVVLVDKAAEGANTSRAAVVPRPDAGVPARDRRQ